MAIIATMTEAAMKATTPAMATMKRMTKTMIMNEVIIRLPNQ